ncbi:MAG: hypothetical protein MUF37_00920 [Methanoregulaceae archaeon]|nr:hypothetical protein [Methanoregulaceae archaeon]
MISVIRDGGYYCRVDWYRGFYHLLFLMASRHAFLARKKAPRIDGFSR